MTNSPLLVGIDVGTTNIKVVAFNPAGEAVAQASQPTPTHYTQSGWAFYEPDELWSRVVASLRAVTSQLEKPEQIVGIACSSIGETGILIDTEGKPSITLSHGSINAPNRRQNSLRGNSTRKSDRSHGP